MYQYFYQAFLNHFPIFFLFIASFKVSEFYIKHILNLIFKWLALASLFFYDFKLDKIVFVLLFFSLKIVFKIDDSLIFCLEALKVFFNCSFGNKTNCRNYYSIASYNLTEFE